MLKKVDLKKITEKARVILDSDMVLKMQIVFGFPGEKHRHIWQSILYGMKLAYYGVGNVLFYRFVPYPGSAYFEQLHKQGRLPPLGPEFDKFLITNVYNELSLMESYSEYVSDRWIQIYMYLAYGLSQLTFFFFHPLQMLGMLKRIIMNTPIVQSDVLYINLIRKRLWFLFKEA